MTADEILQRFRRKGLDLGGELYLPPGVALEAVTALDESDIAVIGLEGARARKGMTEPDPNLIADCADGNAITWTVYRQSAIACARSFLSTLTARSGLYVTLVTQSETEWRGY
jgi:hypothetical protein